MVKDMLTEIGELFKQDEVLRSVKTKTFKRPESLPSDQTSIVIVPLAPPRQTNFGSDKPLVKKFMYQIDVESVSRLECKDLQNRIEKKLMVIDFFQSDNGLERYDEDTNRYLDARTYKGFSSLYEEY